MNIKTETIFLATQRTFLNRWYYPKEDNSRISLPKIDTAFSSASTNIGKHSHTRLPHIRISLASCFGFSLGSVGVAEACDKDMSLDGLERSTNSISVRSPLYIHSLREWTRVKR